MGKATRQSFGEAIADLAAKYTKVVVLDADLSKSTKSEIFKKKFPERFFQMGICEANMVGVAAGMAINDFIPFICSFGCFITGRYDQIRMSVGYNQTNVKIIGTHAGLNIGQDGYSQMALEDISLMRVIPNMVVLQPADDTQTKACIEFAVQHKGPVYLRLTRGNCDDLFKPAEYKFKLGQVDCLKTGSKVALVCTGVPTSEANKALALLASSGITPALYNVASLKPISSAFFKELEQYETVITVEDHTVLGGLGGIVAEGICDPKNKLSRIPKLVRHGVLDVFGESGSPEELYQKYKLDAAGIASVVKESI